MPVSLMFLFLFALYCGQSLSAFIIATYVLGLVFLGRARDSPEPTIVAPYRVPDPGCVAKARAAEGELIALELGIRRRAGLSRGSAWVLILGAFIGGIGLGRFSMLEGSPSSQEPVPTKSVPVQDHDRCMCRETMIVVLDFDVQPLGSPLEPWPHLVLRRAFLFDVMQYTCD